MKNKTLRNKIYNDITELIGNTPLVKINKINNYNANIFAKLEYFNPLSSIKDRIALSMINEAEKNGLLNQNSVIVEPTSGNTGIGIAYICAVKGYECIIVMPDSMSIERRRLVSLFGAELILTPASKGMNGAIQKAEELIKSSQNHIMLQQFNNPANPDAHRKTTSMEIWNDTNGNVDIVVCGVGTGGTITGIGETLKQLKTNIKIIAVEPQNSPVLSGGQANPHKIQGIGAGFIPQNLNTKIIDEIITVSDQNAFDTSRLLAKKEGIFVGISSGAAMFAALETAKKYQNKNIVVILPDTGERYLSTQLFSINK